MEKNDHRNFHFVLLINIHTFYDGNENKLMHCMLEVSIRSYNFNKTSSIVNKGKKANFHQFFSL